MAIDEARSFRVKSRGLLTWHYVTAGVAGVSAFGLLYPYLRFGSGSISGWIWIWIVLTAFWASFVVVGKWTYPGSISVFEDRVELHTILGGRKIRLDMIGPPTAVEGAYVWFRTSPNASGFWGTVLRVNGPVARIILASSKHPPWPVPPDLAQKIATLDS